MKNKNLIKKVAPYFYKYRFTLFLDLFCAGLTTASEMILPLILRALTVSYTHLTLPTTERV